LDYGDASTQFQSSGGTTAVTAIADFIGYARDLSPNGKNATQATSTKRPVRMGMPRTLGSELAGNNRFTDGSVWTLGAGWLINRYNNNLSQDGIFYRAILESGLANTAPLTGISIQSSLPLILRGSEAAMTNLTDPSNFNCIGSSRVGDTNEIAGGCKGGNVLSEQHDISRGGRVRESRRISRGGGSEREPGSERNCQRPSQHGRRE